MIGPRCQVEWRSVGKRSVLAVSGELDLSTFGKLQAAIDEHSGPDLVIDLAGVTFIDSVGLRTLLKARERFGEDSLLLVAPNGPVLTLLELTKLTESFSLSDGVPRG